MTPDAKIDWVEVATGKRQRLCRRAALRLYSGELWSDIRLVLGRIEPGEIPEGYLPNNVVVIHLGAPQPCEVYWSDRGWRTERLLPNSVQVYPAGMPYAARWHRSVEFMLVEIGHDLIAAVVGRDASDRRREFCPVMGAEDRFITHTVLALGEDLRAGSPAGPLYGESLGSALVAHLLRKHTACQQDSDHSGPMSKETVARLMRYIGDNLEGNLSLRDLADLVEMNVYQLVRSFKHSTGMPPHQYVLRERIVRAKALLGNQSLSITEVALRSGFGSHSHFATAFHRMTNVTPRAYRNAVV